MRPAALTPEDDIPDWLETYISSVCLIIFDFSRLRCAQRVAPAAGEFDATLERVVHRAHTIPIRGMTDLSHFENKAEAVQMLNPALRPSIISGLSFPQSYTIEGLVPEDEESLEDLPDTSILFKGYAGAGKMINVYDWFDHFRRVLEGQRARGTKEKGKGKGKGKKVEQEEDNEKWKLSVQARFMRALHELDYLGFIKHTSRGGGGRKGEYVLRTVLGVLE